MPAEPKVPQRGLYLHDNRRLLRFECLLADDRGAVLEDCSRNQLVSMSMAEFIRLKRVKR